MNFDKYSINLCVQNVKFVLRATFISIIDLITHLFIYEEQFQRFNVTLSDVRSLYVAMTGNIHLFMQTSNFEHVTLNCTDVTRTFVCII